MKKLIALIALILSFAGGGISACADTETALWPAYDPETGLWGYIDKQGEWGIALQYIDAYDFEHGFARVRMADEGDTYGIIDTTGAYIFEPKYFVVNGTIGFDGQESNGVFLIERDGLSGWFDPESGYISGLCWRYCESYDDSPYIIASVARDKTTFVNRSTGKRLLPLMDMSTYGFYEGVAVVWLNDGDETILIGLDGSMTYLPEGLHAPYSEISDGLLIVKDEKGLCGYVGLDGQVVIEPQYVEAQRFSHGYGVVSTGEDSLLIDRAGNVVAEDVQFVCGLWADGGIAVERTGCWAVLNADGTERFRVELEPYRYSRSIVTYEPLVEDGPWWVGYAYGGVGIDFGLMTSEGEWLRVPDTWEGGVCLDDDRFSGDPMGWQATGYAGGFIDAYGNEVFPEQWYYTEHFDGALARVWFGEDAAGYINRNGETVYQWTEE